MNISNATAKIIFNGLKPGAEKTDFINPSLKAGVIMLKPNRWALAHNSEMVVQHVLPLSFHEYIQRSG